MEEAKRYLVLRGLEKELENLLNLESLGLEVKIEHEKLIIVKRNEDWKRNLHVALWWKEEKLLLSVDLCFTDEKSEDLKNHLESLKKRLQKFYKVFCPSVEEEIKEVGRYGIKVKEFNTHTCEIIGHIVVALCITLLKEG